MWMRAVHRGMSGLALTTLVSLSVGEIAGQANADPNQVYDPTLFADLDFRMVGPARGGRVTAVAGHAGEEGTFYMGAVGGGVWKTTDYGHTWVPIFDDQPTGSIGAIAIAPSDTNIIYVGSGEGLQRPDLSVGDGIYKSRDGGETWTHFGLRDGQQIPQIIVDPDDPDPHCRSCRRRPNVSGR